MKLMHGYLDRFHGRGTHAVCTEDGQPLEMTEEHVERIVTLWNSADVSKDELLERNRMLADIALSALALKMNIELGATPPPLYALNRDLAAFARRFGGLLSDEAEPLKLDEKGTGHAGHSSAERSGDR